MREDLSLVRHLIDGGEFTAAEQAVSEILSLEPHNATALYLLGLCFLSSERLEEATSVLDEAIDLDPEDPDFHIAISRAYAQAGDFRLSELHLIIALSLNPDSPEASLNLARLYEGLDRHQEALIWYELSESLAPSLFTKYELAMEYARMGAYFRADGLLSRVEAQMACVGRDEAPCSREELSETRQEIQALFYEEEGYSLDLAKSMVKVLRRLKELNPNQVRRSALEAEALVCLGVLKHLDQEYHLWSLEEDLDAHDIVCLVYAGNRLLEVDRDVGFDLSGAYDLALELIQAHKSQ